MKKILIILLLPLNLFSQDIGGDYYVATDGNDSNPGTYESPWATLTKAVQTAGAGDTVYFMGGIYYTTQNSSVSNSGTYDAPICFFGYPGDTVIFDAINHCDIIENPFGNVYNGVIYIERKQHLHFKNFTIRNVFQCDSVNNGAVTMHRAANLTFERITLYNIGSRGFDATTGGGAYGDYMNADELAILGDPISTYDTTRWIDCDVYDVFDTLAASPGNASDAWKTVHYAGNYVEWIRCRAWFYGDDGWDPNSATSSFQRGSSTHGIPATRVFTDCWAMPSNKYFDAESSWVPERGGWKFANAGGDDTIGYNSTIMTNCLVMFGGGIGEIYAPAQRGIFYNNTVYKGATSFSSNSDDVRSIYRNNLSYEPSNVDPGLKRPYHAAFPNDTYIESHNTWDRTESYPYFQVTDTVTVTDADFVYTDSVTLVQMFTAARGADGSLPPIPIQLVAGSDLIDAGTDVFTSDLAPFTLTYDGTAPDIGAGGAVKVSSSGGPDPPVDPPVSIGKGKPGRSAGGTSVLNGKVLIF